MKRDRLLIYIIGGIGFLLLLPLIIFAALVFSLSYCIIEFACIISEKL